VSGRPKIAFRRIAVVAAQCADLIVSRWLPAGRREGQEWVARNPLRVDRHPGSFKVNLSTGAWSDFATGDRGSDLISLGAYLHRIGQREAAERLADMLGVNPYDE
jgi:hypothetical protein